MVFVGVLARAKYLNSLILGMGLPPMGCITSQGLRHSLDVRMSLILQFGSRVLGMCRQRDNQ